MKGLTLKQHAKRNREIVRLAHDGLAIDDIADRYGLKRGRIIGIVRKSRRTWARTNPEGKRSQGGLRTNPEDRSELAFMALKRIVADVQLIVDLVEAERGYKANGHDAGSVRVRSKGARPKH